MTRTFAFVPFSCTIFVYSGHAAGPGKIVLGGRLNLPEGFGPTPYEKRKELPQRSLDSSTLQVNTTPSSNYAGTTGTKPTGSGSKASKGPKAALHDIAEEGSESEGESSDDGEGSQAGSGDEGADDEVAVQQRKRVKRTIIDSDEDE